MVFSVIQLDHFFSDTPAAYKDYVSVPKVDIEDKKDFYEITCDMPGFTKDQISISYENGICPCPHRKRNRRRKKMMTVIIFVVNVPARLLARRFNVKGSKKTASRQA